MRLDTNSKLTASIYGTGLGVTTGVAFVWPAGLPVSLFGLFLLIGYLKRQPVITWPTAFFLTGFFFGKALMALSWFWSTYPLSWIGALANETVLTAITFYWLTASVWLAAAGLFVAGTIVLTNRVVPRTITFAFLPVIIVIGEWFGAMFFSLMTYGPGATIGGDFAFGATGFLAPLWLWPLGAGLGVYSLGVLLLSIVTLLIVLCDRRLTTARWWLVSIVGITVVLSLVTTPKAATPTGTIAIIETNFSRTANWPAEDREIAHRETLRDLLTAALVTVPTYVLLPEDARFFNRVFYANEVGMPQATAAWRLLADASASTIIDTARTETEQGAVQRTYFVSGATTSITAFDKQYLVPQGEFMPAAYAAVLRLVGLGVVADALGQAINYVPGPLIQNTPTGQPGVLACFASVAPLEVRRLVRETEASFIVHPVSHAWFNQSAVLSRQLDRMVQLQAYANNRTIVMSGNNATSKVYLPNGTVVIPPVSTTTTYGLVRVWDLAVRESTETIPQ